MSRSREVRPVSLRGRREGRGLVGGSSVSLSEELSVSVREGGASGGGEDGWERGEEGGVISGVFSSETGAVRQARAWVAVLAWFLLRVGRGVGAQGKGGGGLALVLAGRTEGSGVGVQSRGRRGGGGLALVLAGRGSGVGQQGQGQGQRLFPGLGRQIVQMLGWFPSRVLWRHVGRGELPEGLEVSLSLTDATGRASFRLLIFIHEEFRCDTCTGINERVAECSLSNELD